MHGIVIIPSSKNWGYRSCHETLGPHNNQIQETGADSAYQGLTALPASDLELSINREGNHPY